MKFSRNCLTLRVGGPEQQFIGDEMRMQTWRRIELLQMLEVTTTGSYAGSKALDEVRHRLVDVFSWQLFPDAVRLTTHHSY